VPLQTLAAVADHVSSDRDDRHRPQLATVDYRHTFKVDIAPSDTERLADPHTRAQHERHDVREVPSARTRPRPRLLLVVRRSLQPGKEPTPLLRRQGTRLPGAGLNRVQVPDRVVSDRLVLDRDPQDQRHDRADGLP
jgi:hypothetical protein